MVLLQVICSTLVLMLPLHPCDKALYSIYVCMCNVMIVVKRSGCSGHGTVLGLDYVFNWRHWMNFVSVLTLCLCQVPSEDKVSVQVRKWTCG